MATSKGNVFAGGDATDGAMTVVDAIADGHRAARAIHSFLSGEPMAQPRKRAKTRVAADVLLALEETADEVKPAAQVPRIPDAYRRSGFSKWSRVSIPVACRESDACTATCNAQEEGVGRAA